MGRRKLFLSSLIAGYFSSGANFCYTLLSVPIALHYLSKEEFGLWALVVQIGGYLMLLDLGMSSSVARFLADYKDAIGGREYKNIMATGKAFFWIQAAVMALVGIACTVFAPDFLGIPSQLRAVFQQVIFFYSLSLALGLALRVYSLPLWGHQRTDIGHWTTVANLCTALGVMTVGFMLDWGIFSFLAGALFGGLWSWFMPWAVCHRLNLLPAQGDPGIFSWNLFLRMLGFGRDVLLIQLGTLLCSGAQIILVTKFLGLEAVAIFSVATKTLTMGQQLIGRILESAAPGLTELFVRGDRGRFIGRFYQILTVSMIAALSLSTALMAANRDFVSLWTRGHILWSSSGDLLLAGLLIVGVATRGFQEVFLMSANLSRVRWLPLLEGASFVVITSLFKNRISLEGILLISLLGRVLISLATSAFRTLQTFPSRTFWFFCPFWIIGVFFVNLFFVVWLDSYFKEFVFRFFGALAFCGMTCTFLAKNLLPRTFCRST